MTGNWVTRTATEKIGNVSSIFSAAIFVIQFPPSDCRTLEFAIVMGEGEMDDQNCRRKKSKTYCVYFYIRQKYNSINFRSLCTFRSAFKNVIFASLHDSGLKIISKRKINTADMKVVSPKAKAEWFDKAARLRATPISRSTFCLH